MSARGLFWEDADARAVADRLRRNGFDAELARERFAGEDDDEDHPWAVVTDAPPAMLEVLLEEYDGWLRRHRCAAAAGVAAAAGPARRPTPCEEATARRIAWAAWTNGCCSCTLTPTTRRSARAPRWRATPRAAPRSPW